MPSIPPRFPLCLATPIKQASILDPDCDGEKLRVPNLCNKGEDPFPGSDVELCRSIINGMLVSCRIHGTFPWLRTQRRKPLRYFEVEVDSFIFATGSHVNFIVVPVKSKRHGKKKDIL